MELKGVNLYGGEATFNVEQRVADRQLADESIEGVSGVQTEKTYTKEEINKDLDHLNKWLEARSSHLKFILHEQTNKYYVQVINDQTNEVLKEIPSKKMMDLIASFHEKMGLIMDEKV